MCQDPEASEESLELVDADGAFSSLVKEAKNITYQQPRKALDLLAEAEKIQPSSSLVLRRQSRCFLVLKQMEEAVLTAKKAVSIDPNSYSYRSLARAFSFSGQYQLARKAIEQAIENKASPVDYLLLAQIELEAGNFNQAEKAARSAVEKRGNVRDQNFLTRVLRSQGNYSEAETTMRKLVAERGADADIANLADLLRKQKRYDEALAVLQRVQIEGYVSYSIRAYCLMHICRYDEALRILELVKRNYLKDGLNFRFWVGCIFLYQNCSEVFRPQAKPLAKEAADWLWQLDKSKLKRHQKLDYLCALIVVLQMDLI